MYTEEHSESFHKEYIRNKIFEYVYRAGRRARVLTLAHTNYDLEMKLLAAGHTVTIVEQDKDIHKLHEAQFKNMLNVYVYNDSVSLYLARGRNTLRYDVAYLDFCGCFSTETHRSLLEIKANVIFLTVTRQRETYNSHLYQNESREDVHNQYFKLCGYKQVEMIQYSNNGTALVVYVLKRVKQLKFKGLTETRTMTPMIELMERLPGSFEVIEGAAILNKSTAAMRTFISRAKQQNLLVQIKRGKYHKI